MILSISTRLQKLMHEKVFHKQELLVHEHFERIGKKNAILKDAQTYSFKHRSYNHTSNVIIKGGNHRVPMLDSSLEEEFAKALKNYGDLTNLYDKCFSMLNYIRLHHHTSILYEKLPSFLRESNAYAFNYTGRGYDDQTLDQILKTFDDCYQETLDNIYDMLFMNDLT